MIKLLPSYVGSKAYWVKDLLFLKGRNFVELFCGSSVISINLARKAYLNDTDPIIFKILSNFSDLKEMDVFTKEDFKRVRPMDDWWKYIYYLQKMSFSGVFRYSKNGYNVPIKKGIDEIKILPELLDAKKRFNELNPTVKNHHYSDIDFSKIENSVIVLDPPYEGSKASYNSSFDYKEYWYFVNEIKRVANPLIIFDSETNLEKQGYLNMRTRKMRVNGKYKGNVEAMVIINKQ